MKNHETYVYNYIDSKTGAHIVKAVTTYEGNSVYAYAKCDPEDEFSLEFGTQLALKRLDIKVAQKRAAHAKEYAKNCRAELEYVECYIRRLRKSIKHAEIAYSDRMVEVNQFEKEISEMFG
jgi:cell fate (sporulation/competence/biofilm development) regulator YmcA (YheA/YmcA/DUF963 family)